jgi:hypothetical protein
MRTIYINISVIEDNQLSNVSIHSYIYLIEINFAQFKQTFGYRFNSLIHFMKYLKKLIKLEIIG